MYATIKPIVDDFAESYILMIDHARPSIDPWPQYFEAKARTRADLEQNAPQSTSRGPLSVKPASTPRSALGSTLYIASDPRVCDAGRRRLSVLARLSESHAG